jgi:DNA-binding transcriptional ArsR family regulator
MLGNGTKDPNVSVQNGHASADQEQRLLAVLNSLRHPVRRRILEAMAAHQDVLSPKELSDLLDVPLGTISYHIRDLEKRGAVNLSRTIPRRGALQHYYSSNISWGALADGDDLVIYVRGAAG